MEKSGLSLAVFLLFINVGGAVTKYIATGANHTFFSTITETIEAIQWTHANNIVVEWDSPNTKPHWYRYSERGQLNIATGDLTLRVVKEDSGVFKGQFQVKGVLRYAEYTITVIDPVPKPSVTCVRHNETQVTLKCKVNSPVQPKFKWTGPNEFSQDGDSLQISNTGTSAIYYCIVSNNVSNDSTEFNLSKCFPDSKSEINIAAIVVPIVIIGLALVGILLWKTGVYRLASCPLHRHDAGKNEGAKTDRTNSPHTEEEGMPLGS